MLEYQYKFGGPVSKYSNITHSNVLVWLAGLRNAMRLILPRKARQAKVLGTPGGSCCARPGGVPYSCCDRDEVSRVTGFQLSVLRVVIHIRDLYRATGGFNVQRNKDIDLEK